MGEAGCGDGGGLVVGAWEETDTGPRMLIKRQRYLVITVQSIANRLDMIISQGQNKRAR